MKLKAFSVFSGVGGFELGLMDNYEIVGFSEIDKYASQVLKYNFLGVPNYGDISAIQWDTIPYFDLLTGGSPCQDFSIAGKRKGLGGSRSSLAWEFVRGLRDKKPRGFIWENVKGVMSSRNGWDFANLLCAFSESGYALWWQVLNAKDFGVPQNRERIFVIGVREGSPKEIFFKPKDSGQIEIVGTTIGEQNTRHGERDSVYAESGIMGGLKATDYKQPPQILVEQFLSNSNQRNVVYDKKGIAPALNTAAGGGLTPLVRAVLTPNRLEKRQNGRRMKNNNEPSFTLNTQDMQGVYNGQQVRKLMPIECERLMSWPDNWTKWGINDKGEKIEMSDSQRYKMCGNGVVSVVIKEIHAVLNF